MEKVAIIISYVNDHISAISLFFVIIGGIFAWIKFREYVKDKRFITYHKLVDQLVDKDSHQSKNLMLDRQIAIIYELRNFPRYYEVTQRILEGLISEEPWRSGNQRLIKEVNLTLDYIKSNKLTRIFKKITKDRSKKE